MTGQAMVDVLVVEGENIICVVYSALGMEVTDLLRNCQDVLPQGMPVVTG